MRRDVLLIDNLDSFSFNLVEAFERQCATVRVLRNTVDAAQAIAFAWDKDALIVLSPGPGRPEDAGCTLDLIGRAIGHVPVLGICLGHQAIVHQAGGVRARNRAGTWSIECDRSRRHRAIRWFERRRRSRSL